MFLRGKLSRRRQVLLLVDCSQPLFFNARETNSKRSELEARGSGRFSRSATPTLSSLPFCTGVQLSQDSIRAFNDRITILENKGLWTVYNACTPLKRNVHPNDYTKQRTDEQQSEWTRDRSNDRTTTKRTIERTTGPTNVRTHEQPHAQMNKGTKASIQNELIQQDTRVLQLDLLSTVVINSSVYCSSHSALCILT